MFYNLYFFETLIEFLKMLQALVIKKGFILRDNDKDFQFFANKASRKQFRCSILIRYL